MPLLNYTTEVPVSRTVEHVNRALVRGGARAIMSEYDASGRPVGVAFQIQTPYGLRGFTLPVDVDGVFKALNADKGVSERKYRTRDHAERVAWRILKDWLEVQLAMVQAQMVAFDQVMLPYMQSEVGGPTVYELYRDRQLALPAGEE